jgi:hypothetical protein
MTLTSRHTSSTPPVIRFLPLALVVSIGLLAVGAPVPASASPGDGGDKQVKKVRSAVKIKPHGLRGGRAKIMSRITIGGNVKPWSPGQRLRVRFFHNARQFMSRSVKVKKGPGKYGTFRTSILTKKGGKYAAQARYYGKGGPNPVAPDSTVRKSWKVRFTSLSPGQCGRTIRGFRRALNDLAVVPSNNNCFDGKMQRAVLAYRKMNSLGRSPVASKTVVEKVFNRQGRYRVRRADLGDHMETSLSKQVLVFAKGKRPYAIFPIASGAPATPTILGTFSVYRKDPGYNSLGMYYSSYFIRGYAIHGYQSVPNYPASHGCLRTFIADQPRIYEKTFIGQPIYVYGNARSLSTPFGYRGVDPARFDPAS